MADDDYLGGFNPDKVTELWLTNRPWESNPNFFNEIAQNYRRVQAETRGRDGNLISATEWEKIRRAENLFKLAQSRNWMGLSPSKGTTSGGGQSDGGAGGGSGSGSGGSGSGGSGGGQGSGPNTDGLKNDKQRGAFATMYGLLDQYGLGGLADFLKGLIVDGNTDPATLQLELQNHKIWKERFKGNEELRKKGLGVLSPAEYINLEKSYAQVMRQMGLPAGFYDQTNDFVKFIGNNVSAQELADRAGSAMELVKQVDPTQRQMLASMYGIGEGDIAAYFLNPKKAMPILQKQLAAVRTGAAAKRAGIETDFANAERFERLGEAGVGPEMAAQGYGVIANEMDPLKNLASIWGRGEDWTLDDAEQATFFNNKDAQRERKRLVDQERSAFSGASGYNAGVSGRRSSAGSF